MTIKGRLLSRTAVVNRCHMAKIANFQFTWVTGPLPVRIS